MLFTKSTYKTTLFTENQLHEIFITQITEIIPIHQIIKAVRYVNLPSDFSGKLHENFFQMFTKCLFQRV